jgi:hypothetical protein
MSHITISRLIALLVIVSLILVPAASALPIEGGGVSPASHAQKETGNPLAADSAPSGTSATSSSFDWGDAALGAAGMLVVLSVGASGVVTIRRSRARSHTLVTG